MECFGEILDIVRRKTPVVHSITNYVTVNDCANMILAAGGSPIMADDAAEVEQIVALSSALVTGAMTGAISPGSSNSGATMVWA